MYFPLELGRYLIDFEPLTFFLDLCKHSWPMLNAFAVVCLRSDQDELWSEQVKTLALWSLYRTMLETIPRHKSWDRTGTVVETFPQQQYKVRMDGSGDILRRNRIYYMNNSRSYFISLTLSIIPYPKRTTVMSYKTSTHTYILRPIYRLLELNFRV